jgi:ankyrin repeat protein
LYGEDYGYQNDGKDTVSIATTCFPVKQPAGPVAVSAATGNAHAPDAFPLQLTMGQSPRAPAAADWPAGPAVDRFGRTQLWWAARDGRIADVERLLAEGADPNAVDIDAEAPLHAAARWGHTAVVETLLTQGADPGMSALYGMTPLHIAVEEARLGVTRALLNGGSDVNARDMFGASPLHQAAAHGNYELASLLLAHGADPRALDDGATTPPQLAARSGNAALEKLLLFSAAAPRARHAPAPSAGGEASAPAHTGILRVSTQAGAGRPQDPVTRAAPAAGLMGQ